MRFITSPSNHFEHVIHSFRNVYPYLLKVVTTFGMEKTLEMTPSECHNTVRCFTTVNMLSLFIFNNERVKPTLGANIRVEKISLGGFLFPDHVFYHITYIGKDGKVRFYILQSYYYAYLVSGKYGFIELTEKEESELQTIMSIYSMYSGKTLDESDIIPIESTNINFDKFTGIMHNKAYYRDEYKTGQDYSFQPFCAGETSFFKENDVFSVLRSKLKYILQEIEKESNVYLHFALDNYYLYDTFINDAKICPDHTKLFEELTGYNKKIMKRCIDENKIELSTTFLVKIGKIVHMLRNVIRQIKIKGDEGVEISPVYFPPLSLSK